MTLSFSNLNLSEPIMRALSDEGYTTPTPIQAQAIPLVMVGRDVLGCAQTGTGKTAAFALPIIHRLLGSPAPMATTHTKKPRVLVLSPTRELATQIADSFKTYGRYARLSGAVIYGGVSQRPQEQALYRGVDVIVATPGRLLDLTEQGLVDYSGITTFVLDEADRMLDMGFINPIRQIAGKIKSDRQTLLFSATMPREIVKLAESLLCDPARASVAPIASAAPMIEQRVYYIGQFQKQSLLETLVDDGEVRRAIVFTRTKHGADRVCKKLEQAGVTAVAIHGNKNQSQRQRSLDSFRTGRHRVLVATDVAARGLDVDGITHVFNFDLPIEPEAYVHRIGRTGRAGAAGIAIAFCDPAERRLLRAIEKTTGKQIRSSELPAVMAPSREGTREHSNGHAHQGEHASGRGSRPRANLQLAHDHIPDQPAPPPHNHRPSKPHHPHASPHKVTPHSDRSVDGRHASTQGKVGTARVAHSEGNPYPANASRVPRPPKTFKKAWTGSGGRSGGQRRSGNSGR